MSDIKSSVVVVTDTDVAAVPVNGGAGYSFILDEHNRGPFGGMVPLSDLLNPEAKEQVIHSLSGQFASIPYDNMRDVFLERNGTFYAGNSIARAGHNATVTKSMELYLDDLLKNAHKAPAGSAQAGVVENLRLFLPDQAKAGSGKEALELYARQHGVSDMEAVDGILSQLTVLGRERRESILGKFSAQAAEVGMEAKRATARAIFGKLGEGALADLEPGLRDNEHLFKAVLATLNKRLPGATAAEREYLADQIIVHAEHYRIRKTAMVKLQEMSAAGYSTETFRYEPEDIQNARKLFHTPEASALEHYEGMRAAALTQEVKPGVLASGFARPVAEALEICPPHVAANANASYMRVVLVDPAKNLSSMIPNHTGISLNQFLGGSTSQGIYVKSDLVHSPVALKEEFIHEVDRHSMSANVQISIFSMQPEYQRAIVRDIENGVGNPVYKYLAIRNSEYLARNLGHSKGNIALTSIRTTISADDFEPFVESNPDAYHMAAAADEILAKEDKIKIGNQVFKTRDEIMRAALPNAWQMLEGPGAGMQLIQHANGTVKQIAKDAAVPEGAQTVLSFKEINERLIAERNMGTVEELASAFK